MPTSLLQQALNKTIQQLPSPKQQQIIKPSISNNTNGNYLLMEEMKLQDLQLEDARFKTQQHQPLATFIDHHSTGNIHFDSQQNQQIRKSSKDFENEKGEIINIENIYKKVFDEFSNFSKNFVSKLPQPKSDLKNFLTMFQQEKIDPSLMNEVKDEDIISDKEQIMQFVAYFDYQDIFSADIIKLISEKALQTDNNYIKKAYKYDYIIQINLSTVNGLTLKSDNQDSREKRPIANIFIKFQHLDMDGMILTNKSQKKIVKVVHQQLQEHLKNCERTDTSGTFAPYYDIILDDKAKSKLSEVKMSQMVSDRVKGGAAKIVLDKSQQQINNQQTAPLITFIPKKSDKSEILSDLQISNLIEHFPSMMMTMDWTLVYSINRDGDSVGTFFEKCKYWKYTLLVIKDTNGWIFGGFCSEPWKSTTKFYGTGENFLFTFKDRDEPIVYNWSGLNDQLQWANDVSIGLGGGTLGRFGIYLKDHFYKGSSSNTSTFNNEILSSGPDFNCTLFEVWGFE
eukprot:403334335